MKQISVTSSASLRRWRMDRKWSQRRAAMWYGCSVRMWKFYEEGRYDIPRTLRLRINELHYQERLLTHARDTVLEVLAHRDTALIPFWRDKLEDLVKLLESGTPDPGELQMAPDRIQASESRARSASVAAEASQAPVAPHMATPAEPNDIAG